MPLSNADARERVKTLHSDLEAIHKNVETQHSIFEKTNKDTRIIIDAALIKAGVKTIDELLEKVTNEIDDAEKKAQVKKILEELTPPTTFTGIVWDKIKDPVTDAIVVGKFIAIGTFMNKGWAVNTASWNVSLAQTRVMGAINNAYRLRIAAQFMGEAAIRGVNSGLLAGEIAEVERQTGLAVIDEVSAVEEAEFAAGIDTAIEGVALAEEVFVAAATGGVIALTAVIIISSAEYLWNKHKESEQADMLKLSIAELCTARLFLAQTEAVSQTFASLSGIAQILTKSIIAQQPVDKLRVQYASQAGTLQAGQSTDLRLKELYETLKRQDKGVHTAEDPTFDEMKARHQKELDEAKAKAKANKLSAPKRMILISE